MRSSDRWAFIVLGIGIAAVLGGVQLSAMLDDSPDPPAPQSDFCPARAGGAARSDTDYKESGRPYRGDGPHPVEFNLRYSRPGEVDIPEQWKPGRDGTPPGPQLVACAYDGSGPAKKTDTCQYSYTWNAQVTPKHTTKVSLLQAAYIYQLYEATTSKPVGRIQVPGSASCPMTYTAGSGEVVYQEPDAEKLRRVLRPYVERSLP
ncbi:hypothetical protein ACQEU6_34650 [Spirillospora sp. CA-108201]